MTNSDEHPTSKTTDGQSDQSTQDQRIASSRGTEPFSASWWVELLPFMVLVVFFTIALLGTNHNLRDVSFERVDGGSSAWGWVAVLVVLVAIPWAFIVKRLEPLAVLLLIYAVWHEYENRQVNEYALTLLGVRLSVWAVVTALAIAGMIYWLAPEWQRHTGSKKPASDSPASTTRDQWGRVLAGLLVGLGVFTAASEKLGDLLDQQQGDRYTVAVAMLNDHNRQSHASEIYTLEFLADESPKVYEKPVKIALAAFVQASAPRETPTPPPTTDPPIYPSSGPTATPRAATPAGSPAASPEEHPEASPTDPSVATPAVKSDATPIGTPIASPDASPLPNQTREAKTKSDQPDSLLDHDVQVAMTVLGRLGTRPRGNYCYDVSDANLRGLDVQGASLQHLCARDSDFRDADLRGANLTNSDLRGSDFSYADLSNADLTGVNLAGANLTGANLTHAGLAGSELTGASLDGAILSSANLTDAQLNSASLAGADLRGTNLDGTVVTRLQLESATIDSSTILPSSLDGQLVAVVSMDRSDRSRSGRLPGPGPKGDHLKEVWVYQTAGGKRSIPPVGDAKTECYGPIDKKNFRTIRSSPLVVTFEHRYRLYFGSEDGCFYAVDATTGKFLWKTSYKVPDAAIESSQAFFDGIVYSTSSNGLLYAIDAGSGQPIWPKPTTGVSRYSSPVIAVINGQPAIIVGGTDQLIAINAWTGQPLPGWPVQLDSTCAGEGTSPHGLVWSSPAVVNNIAYFGTSGGCLFAVDLEATDGMSAIQAPLMRLSDLTGCAAPSTAHMVLSAVAVIDGVVYFGSGDQYLYAIDALDGSKRWCQPLKAPIRTSDSAVAPAVVDGVVYIGDMSGWVYAFDATYGRQLWTTKVADAITGGIASSPVVADKRVYVGTGDRGLVVLDAVTGQFITSLGQYSVFAAPVIVDGVIYVAYSNGELKAFKEA